jgi:hypothetical protein
MNIVGSGIDEITRLTTLIEDQIRENRAIRESAEANERAMNAERALFLERLEALEARLFDQPTSQVQPISSEEALLSVQTTAPLARSLGTEQVHSLPTEQPTEQSPLAAVLIEPLQGRRRFLRGAAAAAAGAGLLVVGRSEPAAAVNGDPITVGNTFIGTTPTVLNNSATSTSTGTLNVYGPAGWGALYGNAPGNGAGVFGEAPAGYGVIGRTQTGYSLYATSGTGGNPRIGIFSSTFPSAPTTGVYSLGDIIRDQNGALWLCTVGSPAAVWRRIGGTGSAGAFSLLPSVVRVIYTGSGLGLAAGTIALNTSRESVDLVPTLGLGATVLSSEITGVVAAVTAYPPGGSGVFGSAGYCGISGTYTGSPSLTFSAGQAFNTTTVISSLTAGKMTLAVFGAACEISVDVIGYYR